MSEDRVVKSIVANFNESEGGSCGYCKGKNNEVAHNHGMVAHSLSIDDYQSLIDRGWRRSGIYCYKPTMHTTCCPAYTIKCDSSNFRLSKSQKKIIRKFNKFLCSNESMDAIDSDDDTEKKKYETGDTNIDIPNCELFAPSTSTTRVLKNPITKEPETTFKDKNKPVSKGKGPDPTKLPCKKAKQIRLEKKEAKLKAKGALEISKDKSPKTQEMSVENFLNILPEEAIKKLTIKLIKSTPLSLEWKETENISHNLYVKYQTIIHGDSVRKCSKEQFVRFLVQSPLKIKLLQANDEEFLLSLDKSTNLYIKYQSVVHNDITNFNEFKEFLIESPLEAETRGSVEYGSFHQQYWLDNELIAVGVIDILPKCISSVYFFYNPEFNNLSLGTYGALREIGFTKYMQSISSEIKYYYMGFYIHSCVKMRYKANFNPSFLLCPETYAWCPINDCLTKLNHSKYSRLNNDLDAVDTDYFTDEMIDQIPILLGDFEGTIMKFSDYKRRLQSARQGNSIINKRKRIFSVYGKLIGKNLSSKLITYF